MSQLKTIQDETSQIGCRDWPGTKAERRHKELASIAKRCNARIVEDDPYRRLADAPPPPIATFAPEQVYFISTLSKCLTPGLRVAFVLVRGQRGAAPGVEALSVRRGREVAQVRDSDRWRADRLGRPQRHAP
jgi:hypothetical protein